MGYVAENNNNAGDVYRFRYRRLRAGFIRGGSFFFYLNNRKCGWGNRRYLDRLQTHFIAFAILQKMSSSQDNVIQLKDGRKLGFAEYGDPKGKPLFFFHGWPVSRLSGAVADDAGKKLGIRIISPDRAGYGLSEFQENRQLLDWPDDVLELANNLKIKKFSVVGVSGGGPYAAACAFKIPERLTKTGIIVGLGPTWIPHALKGISLNAKIAWGSYRKSAVFRKLGAITQLVLARYFSVLNRFLFGAKADKKLYSDPEVKREVKYSFKEAFRNGIKGPEYDLYLYTHEWRFNLKDIRTPVYLWYGEEDKNVSLNMGKYYNSQIKGSKLKVYPDEGHLISRTHIEEILKTLI